MTSTASPETAARLTAARKARGLTQAAAGAAVGVDPSTIANWENLRGEPRASQIQRLATAYQTTPGALLEPNPSDYEPCSGCGFDHAYEPAESAAAHEQGT